jgi:hypothetical protein
MVGGPANPRRRSGWMAIQIAPTAATRHTPTSVQRGASGAPESSARRPKARSRNPNCDLRVQHLERSHPAPLEPRGPCPTASGLGRSSAFSRYRSHSSFVDGRDACLVTVCLPAGRDQRDPRHASASSAAADPRVAQQGHMKRRSSERKACGTRSNPILSPHHRAERRETD